jgi:GNAT superfamily N-acetyltransferase
MNFRKATKKDKQAVIDILSYSFSKNKIIAHLFPEPDRREFGARGLMGYTFDIAMRFGEVWIDDDKTVCALAIYPEKRKYNLFHIWQDIKFVVKYVGLYHYKRARGRQNKVKQVHLKNKNWLYLWFIGVHPGAQAKGLGSSALNFLADFSKETQRSIYLETSTLANLPWYYRHGFDCFHQEDLGYTLYFLRRMHTSTVKSNPNTETF